MAIVMAITITMTIVDLSMTTIHWMATLAYHFQYTSDNF